MAQVERIGAITAVKSFSVRVIVSTDLVARGVDLGDVFLPVNCRTARHLLRISDDPYQSFSIPLPAPAIMCFSDVLLPDIAGVWFLHAINIVK